MKQFILRLHFLLLCLGLSENMLAQPAIQLDKTLGDARTLSGPLVQSDANFGSVPIGFISEPKIRKSPDGNFILVSNASYHAGGDKSEAGIPNTYKPWIIKFTAEGTLIWEKTITKQGYSGSGHAEIIPTSDGGYLLATEGWNTVSENQAEPLDKGYEFRVAKLSSDGIILWDKSIGGPGDDVPNSVIETSDGGFLVGGSSRSGIGGDKTKASKGGTDYWIIRLSATGNIIWDASYGTSGNDDLKKIVPAQDGGFLLAGSSSGPADGDKSAAKGNQDFWIVKINATGALQWEKTIGGAQQDVLYHSLADTDKGFLLVGSSTSKAGFDKTEDVRTDAVSDGWVVKINETGKVLWDRTLGGANLDYITYAELALDGAYLLTAYSKSYAGFDKSENENPPFDTDHRGDYWLIKLSQSGEKVWDKTIGGDGFDLPRYGTELSRGKYFMVGESSSDIYYLPGDRSVRRKSQQDIWMVTLMEDQQLLPQTTLRINAGGPDFTTATKKLFIADKYYFGINRTSSIASGDILNTTNDVIYRSGRSAPSFSYNVPVQNGLVNVTLHFAEIYFGAPGKKGGAGSRQFHVNMEGSRKLTNYDIFAQAGGALRANQITIPVTVTDGVLNIDFLSGAADQPRICAIEVVAASVTLGPIADAFVRDGSYSLTNYGTSSTLDIKYSSGDLSARRASYVKFQLPAQTAVTSAKLRIYGHNHENNKSISVHAYGVDNDSWTESGINKNNAPAASTASLGFTAVNDVYQYYEIDVTSYVRAQQQAGESLVTLLLNDPNIRNTRIFFNSREASSNPPQLVIQTSNSGARLGQKGVFSEVLIKQSSNVFPNPVKERFTVSLSPEHAGPISFEMVNAAGKGLAVPTTQSAKPGENAEVNIAGQSFNAGIYLLKIKSDAFTEVVKTLVIE